MQNFYICRFYLENASVCLSFTAAASINDGRLRQKLPVYSAAFLRAVGSSKRAQLLRTRTCVGRNHELRGNKVRLVRRITGFNSTNERAGKEKAGIHPSFCLLKSPYLLRSTYLGRYITTTDRRIITCRHDSESRRAIWSVVTDACRYVCTCMYGRSLARCCFCLIRRVKPQPSNAGNRRCEA